MRPLILKEANKDRKEKRVCPQKMEKDIYMI
jgi:hypothetical protein